MLLSGLLLGRLRREQRKLQRQLRSSSELVAGLAHELRSPLQGLLGAAEVLARGEKRAEHQRLFLDMRRSALHMLHLIDDSLELVRLTQHRPAALNVPFHLEAVVADAIAGTRPLRAERVELAVDLRGGAAGSCNGDPDRLRQILTNLLSNSLTRTRDGHVRVMAEANAAGMELRVQDSGPGIPERRQGELAGAFAQGPRPGKAGMGLAIAGRLVDALGGRLTVYSQPGEGTCFCLWLPFPATPESAPRPLAHIARVGVAEEATLHRLDVMARLAEWGLTIHEFDQPCAVARWVDSPTPLDALLISREWLRDSGAARNLRAICQHRGTILVVHGHPDEPEHRPSAEGGTKIHTRPLLPGDLSAALNEVSDPTAPPAEVPCTVLVVDDNPLVRSLLAATAVALGCRPLLADSGAAALRTAACGHVIDCVLLDRNMPGIDGLETARRLRSRPATQHARLILLVNDEDEAASAAGGDVDHILVRPRGREALERRLRLFISGGRGGYEGTHGQISEQDLEQSLREDLAQLEAGLARGDAATVRDGVHRMRGALRLFPHERHEVWLEVMARAVLSWQQHADPTELNHALATAREALATQPKH